MMIDIVAAVLSQSFIIVSTPFSKFSEISIEYILLNPVRQLTSSRSVALCHSISSAISLQWWSTSSPAAADKNHEAIFWPCKEYSDEAQSLHLTNTYSICNASLTLCRSVSSQFVLPAYLAMMREREGVHTLLDPVQTLLRPSGEYSDEAQSL